jgi:flagellar hook protein FlgE
MSLYSAMLAGVSGLQANSSALAAISNDIANVNTVGFKQTQVDFQDLVNASTDNSTYSAGGVFTANQQLIQQQGTTTQTSSSTDLAITGQGMFVTNTAATTPGTAGSEVEFTRAGSFTPDSAGFLKNTAGLYLMGWPANSQGVIDTSGTNLSDLQPINVDSVGGSVSPTTAASIDGNLNAAGPVSAAATAAAASPPDAGAYDPVANSMTSYDATTNTGVKPDFTMQIPISDSLGGQHTLQIDLLKSATANQWYAEIQTVPTSDVVSGSGLAPGQIAAGTLAFNSDGSIDMTNTTLFGTPPNPTLTFGASNAAAPGAGQVNWASSLGIAAQSVTIGIGGTTGAGALTQFASPSTVQLTTTNGTPFSNLSAIAINTQGIVSATFANGTSRNIAQVAMATFPNVDGLTALSGDAYQASNASGAFSLQTAGSGGAGTITSSSLESSTVDLSAEFSSLIISQNAYAANSKVISTVNQMTQTLLQVIQG